MHTPHHLRYNSGNNAVEKKQITVILRYFTQFVALGGIYVKLVEVGYILSATIM